MSIFDQDPFSDEGSFRGYPSADQGSSYPQRVANLATPAAAPASAANYLSRYALGDPFAAQPRIQRRPLPQIQTPQLAVPQSPSPQGNDIEGGMGQIRQLVDQKQKTNNSDLMTKLDGLMKRFGSLPVTPGAIDTSKRIAPEYTPTRMSPMTGPDTGEVDPNAEDMPTGYFAHLRQPEGTKGNYDAVNPTSGASGPYQFLRDTWNGLMKNNPGLGLTEDGFEHPSKHPEQHQAAINAYTQASMKAITPILGRKPTMGELYSMHIFGQGGGANFLKNLSKPVGEVIPQSWINANPWMKSFVNKPGSDLLAQFDKMLG